MLQSIFSFSFILLTLSASAQKEKFWLNNSLEDCKKKNATHYLLIKASKNGYQIEMFNIEDQLKMVGTSNDSKGKIFDGYFEFFHPNGMVESKGTYQEDTKVGIWERFDAKGNRLAERSYAAFNPNKMAYTYVDEMPMYGGGNENFSNFLKQKLQPLVNKTEYADKGVSLELGFIVSEEGFIENVEFTQGLNPEWDKSALEAIKAMPIWNPGKKFGETVRVFVRLPLELSL